MLASTVDRPSVSPCWSSIVKSGLAPRKEQCSPDQVILQSCKSTKGISVAVIDANAIIEGGERLYNLANKIITVPEVLSEIRDPVSRRRLSFFPTSVDSSEPTPEAVQKVIKFARASGDLQTLSNIDVKVIALAYTFEAQINGTQHIRDAPPPVHSLSVKRVPEKEMPGWGSNVPNLEEWEKLEDGSGDGSSSNSKILPLKSFSSDIVSEKHPSENSVRIGNELHSRRSASEDKTDIENVGVPGMIGEQNDDTAGDWLPAVSHNSHRRYHRKQATWEYEALSQKEEGNDKGNRHFRETSEATETKNGAGDDEHVLSLEDSLESFQKGKTEITVLEEEDFLRSRREDLSCKKMDSVIGVNEVDLASAEVERLDILTESDDGIGTSDVDDNSNEQKNLLGPLSESTVACVTSDFAMQNVLLQMGLRLLSPGGKQIRKLHRWILKCHACYSMTTEIGRIFCSKCGNGGTLRRVAVTVDDHGITAVTHRSQIRLRGTKFSLPLPRGGREAISKNPVLREDQLPHKFLFSKAKKKQNNSKQEEDVLFLHPDEVFGQRREKKAPPCQSHARQAQALAMAAFRGKRNPNDNHFSRPRH